MELTIKYADRIKEDETMRQFCESLVKRVDRIYELNTLSEGYQDKFSDAVYDELFDLAKTEIDYEGLLERYLPEIGYVLYDMDNHGYPIGELTFIGYADDKKAVRETFNHLIHYYCYMLRFGNDSDKCH